MKKELLQIRIHEEDKKDLQEHCRSINRSISELILDYIKDILIKYRIKKHNKNKQ